MFEYYSDIAVTKAMRRLIALQQHFLPQRAGVLPKHEKSEVRRTYKDEGREVVDGSAFVSLRRDR